MMKGRELLPAFAMVLSGCFGHSAPGIQDQPLPSYEEYRRDIDCALAQGQLGPMFRAFANEDCIRNSWDALVAMSRHLACEEDKDCALSASWPPVGPEYSVVARVWADYSQPEYREFVDRLERSCGNVDNFGPWRAHARCVRQRCTVVPAQHFPFRDGSTCESRTVTQTQ